MQYHKIFSYLLLFFLISSILVVMSPATMANITGSIGNNIRSDGSYLYMTMEDGILPYFYYQRSVHSMDSNSMLEGKYCLNMTYDGALGALYDYYSFDIPIRPAKTSCLLKINQTRTDATAWVGIETHIFIPADVFPPIGSHAAAGAIKFQGNDTIKCEGEDNSGNAVTYYFTTMSPWKFDTIYKIEFTYDYPTRKWSCTLSNNTASETISNMYMSVPVAYYREWESVYEFWLCGDQFKNINYFVDDWTVGTQSNIETDAITNIEATNASFNGELINDGSPLQNASQSNQSVKILYDTVSHQNTSYEYYFNAYNTTIAFDTGPQYMVDADYLTAAIANSTTTDYQMLIDTNYDHITHNNIHNVSIRAHGYCSWDRSVVDFIPFWNNNTNSGVYQWYPGDTVNRDWSQWYDITPNFNVTWDHIQNLSLFVNWSTYKAYANPVIGMVQLKVETNISDYAYNATVTDVLMANTTNTDTFSKTIEGLTPGQVYYYRTYINTSYTNSSSYSYGDETFFLTKPEAPTGTSFTFINSTAINLSWIKGTGANRTIIVSGSTGMPSSVTDGTIIYNNTGSYYIKTITAGTSYYLRSWSYSNWTDPNLFQYSDNHTDFNIGGLYINCYDEINLSNLTFDVSIVNEDGSDVYTNWSCINTHTINVSLCPQGLVSIQISSNNHITRVYYLTIQENIFYVLNTYLAINQTEKTALYYLRIVETRETSGYAQDYGVENVLITIKRYINTTGIYETISSLYSDANGYINLYLIYDPSTDYKVFTNKSGYNDTISSYTPMPPNVYGQTTEKWFRITKTLIEQPTPPTTLRFKEVCNINGTWITINNTLLIVFIDYMGETNDIQFYIYEIYETNKTLKNTSNIYNGNISLYIADLNNSRTHEITLFLNHTTLGYIKDYSFFVYGIKNATLSESWIEDQLIDAFGNFDMGYVKMFIIWGPGMLILLALAGANHPGIGIIGSACWIVLLSWKLNAISVDTDTALIILFGLLLILGFIRLITKRRPDETGEG